MEKVERLHLLEFQEWSYEQVNSMFPAVTLKQYSHWSHLRCGITHITLLGVVFKMKKAGSGGVNSTPGSTNAGISLFDPMPGTREPSPDSLGHGTEPRQ